MLILERYEQQRIYVGDDVIITVMSAHGGRVRLAFSAPDRIEIDREEVRLAKIRDRRLAGEETR